MAQPALQFFDLSANTAIARWAELRKQRGKGIQDSMRKIMRAWVHAADKFTLAAAPPNKTEIRRYLTSTMRQHVRMKGAKKKGSPGGRMLFQLGAHKNMAAAIIWKLNWKDARSVTNVAAFKKLVRKFISARVFSSGIHHAGFFPAYDLVYGRPAGRSGPRYKNPLGGTEEHLLDSAADILAENWASAKDGIGMKGLAGSAFASTLPAVIKIFEEFGIKDELAAAKKAGFAITGTFAAKSL